MLTTVLADGADTRARAARLVAAGGVLAFRTDTFYGLGADPFNVGALEKVNGLKGRDGKPILVVVSDPAVVARLARRATPVFNLLSERHWPGPLTLVVEADEAVPADVTAGTGTVGVRLPDDEEVRELVRACGGALTATSANPAGAPPARTAQEAARYFQGRLELIVDGGPARTELPSTVIDATGDPARLIRAGALPPEELRRTLASSGFELV